jgi:citrate lyase subunit beta / citryl-CoA lyase
VTQSADAFAVPTARPFRSRRTCLAVPGSSERMMQKAQGLPADQVFLDLEDAVAPSEKVAARPGVVRALVEGDWTGRTRTVRVNATDSPWTLGDVVAVVEGAGTHLDTLMLPKVSSPAEVQWLDLTLTQLERTHGLPVGGIGIDVQIEDARGLLAVEAIVSASPRVEAIHFGPGDFQASLGMRTLAVGALHPDYPGDQLHHVFMTLLVAARAHGVQVLDGPFTAIPDLDGLRASALRVAALGFDGKWVLHPTQVDVVNEVFAPTREEFDRAQALLDAYAASTSSGRGAVLHDGEMIDEASAAMARVVVSRGAAAGLGGPG